MSRRFYLWLAAGGFVLVSALYVAQQWIPGPESTSPPSATETAVVDTTGPAASRAASTDTTPGDGDDALVIVALILGGAGLLGAGAAWWRADRGVSAPDASSFAPDAPSSASDAPSSTQMEAADRLAGAAAPLVSTASQFCQLLQTSAQLGEEAPDGLTDRIATLRDDATDQREVLRTELMRDAALLPNRVLQAAHDVEQTVEFVLADERRAVLRGGDIATQLQVSYYTFAGTVRNWTGQSALDVERLLGGAGGAPDADRPPSPTDPVTAPPEEPSADAATDDGAGAEREVADENAGGESGDVDDERSS